MKQFEHFDNFPKAFKKTLRMIRQENMTYEQLESMQKIFNQFVNMKRKQLDQVNEDNRVV